MNAEKQSVAESSHQSAMNNHARRILNAINIYLSTGKCEYTNIYVLKEVITHDGKIIKATKDLKGVSVLTGSKEYYGTDVALKHSPNFIAMYKVPFSEIDKLVLDNGVIMFTVKGSDEFQSLCLNRAALDIKSFDTIASDFNLHCDDKVVKGTSPTFTLSDTNQEFSGYNVYRMDNGNCSLRSLRQSQAYFTLSKLLDQYKPLKVTLEYIKEMTTDYAKNELTLDISMGREVETRVLGVTRPPKYHAGYETINVKTWRHGCTVYEINPFGVRVGEDAWIPFKYLLSVGDRDAEILENVVRESMLTSL